MSCRGIQQLTLGKNAAWELGLRITTFRLAELLGDPTVTEQPALDRAISDGSRACCICIGLIPLTLLAVTFKQNRAASRCFPAAAKSACLKGRPLLANVRNMSRSFSIEVAKDYFNFASAHFLIFADGTREPLHGHNYQVSVAVEGELDHAGVVLDFISFKPMVKRICDSLDHRTLIQSGSSVLKVRSRPREVEVRYRKQKIVLPRQDVILLPLANTSTELLAEHIAGQIRRQVRRKFPRSRIRFMEVGVDEARGQRGIYRGEF